MGRTEYTWFYADAGQRITQPLNKTEPLSNIKQATVLYTAEIELRPVLCGTIGKSMTPKLVPGSGVLYNL